MFRIRLFILAGLILVPACIAAQSPDPFAQNRRLGRGINLGNALEAPKEGDWGVKLKQEYFKIIKDAGFDSVRIPIRWSSHALEQSPYTIDPNFFNRIDWAVKNSLKNNLYVMINMHHYMELMSEPEANSERFIALWKQIAEHYKNYPNSVLFEPLNEPHDALIAPLWNDLLAKTIPVIRESNPNRTIVIDPANYATDINNLSLPENDRNIIVSCHYYLPVKFTHQGAEWSSEGKDSLGTTWKATEEEQKEINGHFDLALEWSKKFNRPINLGEFGVYYKAEKFDRLRWTSYIANSATRRGFSYIYWEFCSGFGIYDAEKNEWNADMLNAIVPQKNKIQ
ncbi:MAG: glycoside hydrolase family 5 protein [Phycisphaerales bacterium]